MVMEGFGGITTVEKGVARLLLQRIEGWMDISTFESNLEFILFSYFSLAPAQ